jgi:hypothetical protein
MYCLCTRCIIVNSIQVRSEFGKFAYTAICMRKCTLWSDNTCVFTRFHSVKNANTQLIWSSDFRTDLINLLFQFRFESFWYQVIIVVFRIDLHKMKIKHRIIGEYATKRCFFDIKKADHRYWKLINYSLTWARPNLFLSIFMPGCCSMDVKIRVCLPRKYGRFMLFINNNLLLPGARLHTL